MRSIALVAAVLLVSACSLDPTRRIEVTDFLPDTTPPTLAMLDEMAAREPSCSVTVNAGGWAKHPLKTVEGSLRLPPGYSADTTKIDADFAGESWTGADSGYVMFMSTTHLGATIMMAPDQMPIGTADICTLRMFGHYATVLRARYVLEGNRDTLHVINLNAPVAEKLKVGGGAMHTRRGAIDTLLAAFASLELAASRTRAP